MKMMKTLLSAAVLCLLVSGAAFAQSSGNFTYSSNANSVTACTLNRNGSISGGQPCEMPCTLFLSRRGTVGNREHNDAMVK